MASVKFGFNHLSTPTPAGINRGVRVATVVIGIFLAWMNQDTLISAPTQHIINSFGGLILGLINGITPLFGMDVTSTDKVSVSDVTSMENKTDKP